MKTMEQKLKNRTYSELVKSLLDLQERYQAMTIAERDSDEGRALLKDIEDIHTEVTNKEMKVGIFHSSKPHTWSRN